MTQRNKSFLWIRRVIGVVFLIWGLPSLLPGLALLQVFGIHGLIWLMEPLIFVVVGLVLLLGGRKKRAKEEERSSSVPWRKRSPEGPEKRRAPLPLLRPEPSGGARGGDPRPHPFHRVGHRGAAETAGDPAGRRAHDPGGVPGQAKRDFAERAVKIGGTP